MDQFSISQKYANVESRRFFIRRKKKRIQVVVQIYWNALLVYIVLMDLFRGFELFFWFIFLGILERLMGPDRILKFLQTLYEFLLLLL